MMPLTQIPLPQVVHSSLKAIVAGTAIALTLESALANQNPTVSIVPKASLTDLGTPAVVPFEFEAADPDGQVVAVDVFDNGGWIASLTNRPFQIHREWWVGEHQLRARARDNEGGVGFSTSVPFTVKAPTPVALKPVRRDGDDLILEWTGGQGPFLVELQADLRDTWTILQSTGSERVARIPISGPGGFVQVNDTAVSGTRNYDAALTGLQVKPAPVETGASAQAQATLYHSTLTFRIEYKGLATPLAAIRVHGPATPNTLGAALLDLLPFHQGTPGTSGILAGSIVLTADQKLAFVGGQTYVSIVESGKTTESLRGQFLPRPLGYEKDHDENFTFSVLKTTGGNYDTSQWIFEFGDPVVTSGQNPHGNRPWLKSKSGGQITFQLTCGRKSSSDIANGFRAASFGFSDLNRLFPNQIAAHLHVDGSTQIPTDMNFFFPVKVTTENGIVFPMFLGQNGSGKGWKGDLETAGEAAKEGYDSYKDLVDGKLWDSFKSFVKFLEDTAKLGSENDWSLAVIGDTAHPAFIAEQQYQQSPYPYVYTTNQLIAGGQTPTGATQMFYFQQVTPFYADAKMVLLVDQPR